MRNRRIALDRISAGPKKQIARLQVFQFKRVVLLTQDRLKLTDPANPGILFARIPRHIADIALFEDKINETRAIHPAATRIGRAVFVIEIAGGEFERAGEKFLHFGRIIIEALDLIGQQGGIGRAVFLRWSRRWRLCWSSGRRWHWSFRWRRRWCFERLWGWRTSFLSMWGGAGRWRWRR